jgi:hypothetical protein
VSNFLYLASQSPRRRQLLEQIGVAHQLLLPDPQEDAEALEALQRHRGVGAQHRRGRQALGLQPRQRGVELEAGHALHIVRRCLARLDRFQRLGIFVRIGQQQLVLYTDLFQQLATARALGSEVNEIAHSRW